MLLDREEGLKTHASRPVAPTGGGAASSPQRSPFVSPKQRRHLRSPPSRDASVVHSSLQQTAARKAAAVVCCGAGNLETAAR
jgi:hypothetical protein